MKKTLSLAIAALCLTATAQAHQVWIEQPGGKSAIARFGEFAENLREASPGYLDGFGKMFHFDILAFCQVGGEGAGAVGERRGGAGGGQARVWPVQDGQDGHSPNRARSRFSFSILRVIIWRFSGPR